MHNRTYHPLGEPIHNQKGRYQQQAEQEGTFVLFMPLDSLKQHKKPDHKQITEHQHMPERCKHLHDPALFPVFLTTGQYCLGNRFAVDKHNPGNKEQQDGGK